MAQAEVAEALRWSLSKVNRIEGGDVTISSHDLTALLSHYGVRDDGLVERLVDDARAARRRGWWTEPQLREHLTAATVQMLQFEAEAASIRCFQPTAVPGLLQTPDYAAAVMNCWSDVLPEVARAARLEVRRRRYAHFRERSEPPQYLLVLDESVVWRQFGGPRVLVEQLQELLVWIDEGRLSVRILPLENPGVDAFIGPFITMDLDDENSVLYRESQPTDEVVQRFDDVARHHQIFEQIWAHALNEQASARLIRDHAASMLASSRGEAPTSQPPG
jgi:hypothetical protein